MSPSKMNMAKLTLTISSILHTHSIKGKLLQNVKIKNKVLHRNTLQGHDKRTDMLTQHKIE
jgi:hypothetical protein